MKNRILVVERPGQGSVAGLFSFPEVEVLEAAGSEQALAFFFHRRPDVIFLDSTLSGAQALVSTIRSEAPWVPVTLICPADALHHILEEYEPFDVDVVRHPVTRDVITAALNRSRRLIRHNESAETRERALGTSNGRSSFKVDTERLLAVQQTMETLTSVMAQVGNDAQAGIRYFHELPYCISIHSRDERVLFANPTYLKYLGNRIGKNSWGIYVGKRGTRLGCPVSRSIRSGLEEATQALVQYQSGSQVPVIVHTAPIFNNDGVVELVMEVFAGTKEIEALAEEIGRTQQRYRQLFDAVPCHVAVLDRRFRITASNRRFRQDFGDHVGRVFFDILRPASFPPHQDILTQTIEDGKEHKSEIVLTDKEGIQYNMMVWSSPIFTSTGKLHQVLVIFVDITELRKLQDHLSSLGMMVATLSHNLKGSLTGLDAGLYLVEKGFYRNKPGRIEEGLDVAKMMADRIRRMAFDILFSSKERDLDREAVDVARFAADVAANMENRIRSAHIAFECDFARDPGEFEIDAALMRTAITNILENAMDACIEDTAGKISRIRFSARGEAEEIVFEISDNGSGMDAGQLKKMFTPFSSSKGHKGTGLGMYITRQMIKKHGGHIRAESHMGSGTRFTIHIPRKPPVTGGI